MTWLQAVLASAAADDARRSEHQAQVLLDKLKSENTQKALAGQRHVEKLEKQLVQQRLELERANRQEAERVAKEGQRKQVGQRATCSNGTFIHVDFAHHIVCIQAEEARAREETEQKRKAAASQEASSGASQLLLFLGLCCKVDFQRPCPEFGCVPAIIGC